MIKRQKFKKIDVEYKDIDKQTENETELSPASSSRKELSYVEKNIHEGDSLQSLAIKYHCTIEDLKRLNNIQKDNEIFAKRTIKVPYRIFSTPLIHLSGRSSPNDSQNTNSELEVNSIIFNSNIIKVYENRIDNIVSEIDEEVRLLPQTNSIGTDMYTLNCSGADGDISWITLVLCTCIIIVAVPLLYVFYIAEHLEKYAHVNS